VRIIVALADGVLFFALWCAVAALSADGSARLWPIVPIVLAPFTVVVAWRAWVLSAGFATGSASPRQFAKDGFVYGLMVTAAVLVLSASFEASAAGGHLDGYSILSTQGLTYIAYYIFPLSLVGGAVGALHGLAFFYLNKCMFAANHSLQARRP